jgi:hypothetical protein
LKKNENPEASEPTNSSTEEIEKYDKKKARTSKPTRSRVLYEVDATNLKMTDRNKRILGSVGIFSVELAFIFIVSFLLNTSEWMMVVGFAILLIAIMFFLPTPLVLAPSKYKITKQGIFFNGEKAFPLEKKYRLKVNQNRNFISVRDRKGEVLKLYTTETEKVMKILDKILASETKSSLKK